MHRTMVTAAHLQAIHCIVVRLRLPLQQHTILVPLIINQLQTAVILCILQRQQVVPALKYHIAQARRLHFQRALHSATILVVEREDILSCLCHLQLCIRLCLTVVHAIISISRALNLHDSRIQRVAHLCDRYLRQQRLRILHTDAHHAVARRMRIDYLPNTVLTRFIYVPVHRQRIAIAHHCVYLRRTKRKHHHVQRSILLATVGQLLLHLIITRCTVNHTPIRPHIHRLAFAYRRVYHQISIHYSRQLNGDNSIYIATTLARFAQPCSH